MKPLHGVWQSMRHEELRDELFYDAYHAKQKLAEPARCPDCGLVVHAGRWVRGTAPAGAHEVLCPACHRIRDEFPAGYVTLHGEFLSGHRDEVLRLVHNVEGRQRSEHPLQRIMAIEDTDAGLLVTTTDAHLARDIAVAVHNAFQGELEFHYNRQDNLLRATWSR
jgi:NMD protein affecting ribosome stability and mRNA decay